MEAVGIKRAWWIVAAVSVAAVVSVLWLWRRGDAIDLTDRLDAAEKRSSGPSIELAIVRGTFRIRGEAKRGIFMHPTSRVTFPAMEIPSGAVFRASVGLKDEAWDKTVDGVLFRVGVSDGKTYTELSKRHVNPSNDPNDRRWIPLEADLDAYAGRTVQVILNTNSSLPGQGDNTASDWAVWGEPRVEVRSQEVRSTKRRGLRQLPFGLRTSDLSAPSSHTWHDE
jgi:hypothetical protein